MKTAAASVINASPADPPIWNRIRKTSEFLRKLSLNAEKNWVQNRGAKRRVSSKDEDMAGSAPVGRWLGVRRTRLSATYKTIILAKEQSLMPRLRRTATPP